MDKPPFWLSVPPSRPDPQSDARPIVGRWLEHELKSSQIFPLHRLDFETSGLLAFALSPETHRELSLQWQARSIQKKYFVLAEGTPTSSLFKCQSPVEDKSAITQFEVIQKHPQGFSAWALPVTGRRHQIRVHLSQLGHPVIFDSTYGAKKNLSQESPLPVKPRVALHSFSLKFLDGRHFKCPPTPDLVQFEAQL